MTTLIGLTALPLPPQKPMRQKEFDEKADKFLLALRGMATEANSFVSLTNVLAREIETARDTATQKADVATGAALRASSSEALALAYKNAASADRIATAQARGEVFAVAGIIWPSIENIDGYLWAELWDDRISNVTLEPDGYIYAEVEEE